MYNNRVHAKIMVVDKAVAVVSSLNFTSLAGGGSSWEAGLATKEDSMVEDIVPVTELHDLVFKLPVHNTLDFY